MEKLNDVIFYTIEKAIKSYRQYAQKQIKKAGFDITIDQWLVMKCLIDNPDIQLQDLAKSVFKDNASVTRIIDLLIRKNYLKRQSHEGDGRRSTFVITEDGLKTIDAITLIVLQNRKHALKSINQSETIATNNTLQKIISNCILK